MVQGPYQMGRVVGTSPPPPSLGNSGQHSGQETIFGVLPMVLESWWEISENGDRGFTQNFDARLVSIVVCPGEPFFEKVIQNSGIHTFVCVYLNSKIPMFIFPGTGSENVFFRMTLHQARSMETPRFSRNRFPKCVLSHDVAPSQEHWGPIVGLELRNYKALRSNSRTFIDGL